MNHPPIKATTGFYTDYQIAEGGYPLIAWCALTLLLCLPGNTLILVASIKYKALKLDKVSIVLIENIAVADLGMALFMVLPRMVSVIAARWEYACDVTAYAIFLFPGVSILSVTALNISKLTCLLFPLRARLRTHTQGRIIGASLWACIVLVFALVQGILSITESHNLGTSYDETLYMCNPYTSDVEPLYFIMIGFFTIPPILVILVTTIWLMVYVQKVRGLSKESVVTLIAISLVFIVAFIPIGAKLIVGSIISSLIRLTIGHERTASASALFNWYRDDYTHFAHSVPYLNCMANPIIYLFTVNSFKTFVVEMFRGWINSVRTGIRQN